MTAPKEQLQALIAEIDGVLQRTTPRLPWVMSGDATQQRKLLERLRNHLLVLHRQIAPSDRPLPPPTNGQYDIYYQPSWAQLPSSMASGQPSDRTTHHLLQMMTQEILHLRSTLVEPLQSELSSLRQQRDALQAEVRQLEMQRQTYLLHSQQLLNESMQGWMDRLQTNFPQALGQRSASSSNLLTEPDASYPRVSGDRLSSSGPELTDTAIAAQVIPEPIEASLDGISAPAAATPPPAEPKKATTPTAETRPAAPRLEPAPASPAVRPPNSPSTKSWVVDLDPALRDVGDLVASSEDWQFPYPGIEVASPMTEPPAPTTMRSMEDAIDDWLRSANSREDDASSALEFADLDLAELRPGQLEAQEIDSLPVAKDAAVAGGPVLDSELLDPALLDSAPLDFELEAEPVLSPDTGGFGADASAPTLDGTVSLSFEEELTASLGVPTDAPGGSAVWTAQSEAPPLTAENQTRDLDEFYQSLFGSAGTAAPFTQDLSPAQPAPPQLTPPNTFPILGESSGDQISSLEDLFETLPADISQGAPEAPSAAVPPAFNSLHADDRFMLASPDETLLPSAADQPASEPSLELDAVTFNSLSEDLSNLERTPPPVRPAPQRPGRVSFDELSPDPRGMGQQPLRSFQESEEQPPAIAAIPVAPPQQDSWPDFSLDEFASAISEEPAQSTSTAGMPAAGVPAADMLVPAKEPAKPVDIGPLVNRLDSERRGVLDALREAERLVPDFGSLTAVNRSPAASKGQQPKQQPPADASGSSSFTIDDMAELFPDAPSVHETVSVKSTAPANTASAPAPVSDGSAAAFTVERLDDLFVEMPAWETLGTPGFENSSGTTTVDFTLDPVDNVFVEVLPEPMEWLSLGEDPKSPSQLDPTE